MSFIEGVGDEVTGFAVFLLILILAATITYFLNGTPFSGNSPTLSTESNISHSDTERQLSEAHTPNIENCSDNSSAEVSCNDAARTYVEEIIISSEDVDIHVSITNDDDQDQNSSEERNSSEDTSDATQSNLPSTPLNEESSQQPEQGMFQESEVFRVRLKYLDDTERTVDTNPSVKIGDFKRTHFPEDTAANKIVRLIFSGQLLQDNLTLQSYGVSNNCVIHVQILAAQTQHNTSPVNQTTELDLSHLLWPLLSVILGICWILYFKYPDFFNVMSLGMLFMFTGSFVYFYSQVQQQ